MSPSYNVAEDDPAAAGNAVPAQPAPVPTPPIIGPETLAEIHKRLTALERMLAGRVPISPPEWAQPRWAENSVQIGLSKLLRLGDLAFDVGAHFGAIAAMMGAAVGPYGRVVAFEASPRSVGQLHVDLNHSNAFNVTVIHAAVAERSGELLPVHYGVNSASDAIGPRKGADPDAYVPSLALDDYVRQLGRAPRVVKLDIEGAELLALRGFQDTLSKHHPALIIETFSGDLALDEMLQSLGYNLCVDLSDMARYDKRTVTVHSLRNLLYLHEHEDRGEIFRSMRRSQAARFSTDDFTLRQNEVHVDLGNLAPGLYVVNFEFSPAVAEIRAISHMRVGSPDRLHSQHTAELRHLATIRSIPFDLQRQAPVFAQVKGIAPEALRDVLPTISLERIEA